ncbi:ATP-dependent nuclease [Veillonella seminalis]|uniref:ATP-dependent nuclease n=1 Tax=Veillonella seminalis TaxID=1502943 RepID=UPI00402AD684
MYIKNIIIKNFRLLKNTMISLSQSKTVFVGKNNTGKTTVMNVFDLITNCVKRLKFDDYPLSCRASLYSQIERYFNKEISVEELKLKVELTQFLLEIEYSDRNENDSLGELSNFIIDLDETITVAKIKCIYESVSNIETVLLDLKEQYENLITNIGSDDNLQILQQIIKREFHRLFELKIYAINPTNEDDFQLKSYENLKGLFNLRKITAERNLGESNEEPQLNPLGRVLNSLFNTEISEAESSIQPAILSLKKTINLTKYNLQNDISVHMDSIVDSMLQFGYPSDEDLLLKAYTDLDIENSIISGTKLNYRSHDNIEELPDTYNGLGYKNLIKISLILQDYLRSLKQGDLRIHLLFIEEPEAHMHPQLQATFIEYIESFLKVEDSKVPIQIIITTHSSHIANTVPFSQIRYFKKGSHNVVCKNLDTFKLKDEDPSERRTTIEFLQQYIKLNHCDLYFCDKAILVEGTSERLLIKDMIIKCFDLDKYGNENPSLQSQYYTIIEVGGAYAFKFFDFLNFIEIPTLIITDIDFVDKNGKACRRAEAKRSSNGTINRWYRNKFDLNKKDKVLINKITDMLENEDELIDCNLRLACQERENDIHPRSFEEAIMNVNRELYGIEENVSEIEFDSNKESKTDFAFNLLFNKDFSNYTIPSYISKGLVWLSSQKNTANNLGVEKTK